MTTNKVTIEKAKELFAAFNLELLEDEYISRKTKMKYRCPKHPEFIQYRSYQTQLACKGICSKCAKEQASLKTKRSLKTTDLYLYRNTTVPGVLIECGFLTNENDRNQLLNENYQNKMIDCILQSIITYYQNLNII